MTLLILVFGDFSQILSTHNKILVARIVIVPIFWLSKLFSPLIFLLNFIPKLIGAFDKSPKVTEDELMTSDRFNLIIRDVLFAAVKIDAHQVDPVFFVHILFMVFFLFYLLQGRVGAIHLEFNNDHLSVHFEG